MQLERAHLRAGHLPSVRAVDDMDRRYLVLALELGAEEGWDFQLGDIKRVEAMWGVLDGDATSYGFVVELRDARRAYFDYDSYSEDGVVERVCSPWAPSAIPVSMGRLPIGTTTLVS
jgi:hypothetical protein